MTVIVEDSRRFGNYSSNPLWSVGTALTARCYRIWLAGIFGFALAFRIGYVLVFTRFQNQRIYDALWYQLTAQQFRMGEFFPRAKKHAADSGPSAADLPATRFRQPARSLR